jgi:hypothetical protein
LASRKPRISSTALRRRSRKPFQGRCRSPQEAARGRWSQGRGQVVPVIASWAGSLSAASPFVLFRKTSPATLRLPTSRTPGLQRANASTSGPAERHRPAPLPVLIILRLSVAVRMSLATLAGALEDLPSEFGATMTYSYTEKKRIRKSFAKRASVLDVPFLLATQLESFTAFLQASVPPGAAPEPGSAGGVFLDLSDRQSQRQRAPGVRQLHAFRAGLRRHRVPAARPDLRLGAARQGASGHSRSRAPDTIKEVKEQEVYMGEIPLMTSTGSFVINGTERVIVSQLAPLAWRVLRARPGQDAQFGQAALLGTGDSLSRFVAGFRVRSEGSAVLPCRPSPQDAGDDAAQGHRPDAATDPARVLRVRHLPDRAKRSSSSRSFPSVCVAKWRASTSTTRPAS